MPTILDTGAFILLLQQFANMFSLNFAACFTSPLYLALSVITNLTLFQFIIPQGVKTDGHTANPTQVALVTEPSHSAEISNGATNRAGAELAASRIQDIEGASDYIHKCERAIAAAFCSVYNSYSPPVAVMGGPLAPLYYDGVVTQLQKNPTAGRNLKVVLSSMREMSLKGAATLVLRNATSIAEEQATTSSSIKPW